VTSLQRGDAGRAKGDLANRSGGAPEPVSTIAPIAGSVSKASSAALRSPIKAADSAFKAWGRLSLVGKGRKEGRRS
jgi:hypothetical protein